MDFVSFSPTVGYHTSMVLTTGVDVARARVVVYPLEKAPSKPRRSGGI